MRLFFLLIASLAIALSGCATFDAQHAREDTNNATGVSAAPALDVPKPAPLPAPVEQPASSEQEELEYDYGLWTRLAREFTLHTQFNERIERELLFYQGRLGQLETITRRAEPYLFLIVEQLQKRQMPMELALVPIIESAYRPHATSRSRAAGLWQFIPSTGTHFGLKQNWWYDARRDIHASTQAALDYLQYLNAVFNGDWLLSLAAYNAGEGTVLRAIKRAEAQGRPTDYWSLDLPEEAMLYVPRLIALARLFHEPEMYGLNPHKVEDAPFLARLDIGRTLDLSRLANALDMSVEDIYRLNPGFRRGVNTNGREAVALLLPRDRIERLNGLNLDIFNVTPGKMRTVIASKSESLARFARRYKLSEADIRNHNPEVGTKIKRGQRLALPQTTRTASRGDSPVKLSKASIPRSEKGGGQHKTYTVQKGDTLFKIARRFKVNIAQLLAWNGISHKTILKPGQSLIVAMLAKDADKPS